MDKFKLLLKKLINHTKYDINETHKNISLLIYWANESTTLMLMCMFCYGDIALDILKNKNVDVTICNNNFVY